MDAQKTQEAFLDHIANKLGRPRRHGVTPPVWPNKPYAHLYQGLGREDLVQQFIANLAALNQTEVDRIPKSELGRVLHKATAKFAARSVLSWEDERFYSLQLEQCLKETGVVHRVWRPTEDEQELRAYAAQADMGIAFAEMGLAETGTVVLWNGGGRGRLVSLLPPVFVAVLREADIHPRLTQAVAHVHRQVERGLPACINFITGPSRTGDIEMDLAFGVHGPGKVHIILLTD
ncbi:LutC/YkgG family protein [Ferviditalea candida]|uniref:Lactate utilization protein C n=1 Tax=Ferviditalea candida TaxID=3108399 RepID=A0ABU5ZKX1_9BACL|nr:lactate utilization protein C [Paenibacillaceae bacterium T2]